MATLPPPAAGPAGGSDLTKLGDDAAKALGVLYKACAAQNPGSPLCEAIGQMIQALGAIEMQLMSGGGAPEEAPSDYPVPPGQQGPMDQAGAQMAAMMGAGQDAPQPSPLA